MHAGDTAPNGYHIASADADMPAGTAPRQRTPGGDFGWLRKTYNFSVRGTPTTEFGQTHGHNIVAVDTVFAADTDNTTAPGGTFPGSQLGCTSCHDPHSSVRRLSDGSYANGATLGQKTAPIIGSGSYDDLVKYPNPAAGEAVGVYRLLRGLGDTHQGVTFNGVAIAVVPSTYNRTELTTQTRVAYGATGDNTWGNWCATCHPDNHSTGNKVHPIDRALDDDVVDIYNAYVKTGDLSGVSSKSFNSLVPFAEANASIATLQLHAKNNDSYLNGPNTTDQVMCLSCHRAHASGFPDMLRWNMENEFMVYQGTYTTKIEVGRGRTETEMAGAYYDRPATVFATYQRALCNKCHAKD